MNKVGISLGNNCFATDWGIKKNLRKKKAQGYKTCPFDIMVSNYQGVVQCILNDFNDFCNPDYFLLNEQGLYHTKYNFSFNHESPGHADLYKTENWPEGPNHFTNNNYQHFIERYNNRIQAFREYLNDPNNFIIFFIQFVEHPNPNNNCQELRHALSIKYPKLKYDIIVI
jgi:hypothetical protein